MARLTRIMVLLAAAAALAMACDDSKSRNGDSDSDTDADTDTDTDTDADSDTDSDTDTSCPPGWHLEGGECVPDAHTCPYLGGKFALEQQGCAGITFPPEASCVPFEQTGCDFSFEATLSGKDTTFHGAVEIDGRFAGTLFVGLGLNSMVLDCTGQAEALGGRAAFECVTRSTPSFDCDFDAVRAEGCEHGGEECPEVDPGTLPQPARQHTRWVTLGDSISTGFGASPGHGYTALLWHNDGVWYPDWCARDLETFFPDLEKNNFAQNAVTTVEVLGWQLDQIPTGADQPTLITITIGGNELIHDYGRSPPRDTAVYGCEDADCLTWSYSFQDRLEQIFVFLRDDARFPEPIDIYIADIYDPSDGTGDISGSGLPDWPDGLVTLGYWNERIRETAVEYDATVVCIHDIFLGHGLFHDDPDNPYYDATDPTYWYFINLEDPNDLGYQAVRRVFWEAIATDLGIE